MHAGTSPVPAKFRRKDSRERGGASEYNYPLKGMQVITKNSHAQRDYGGRSGRLRTYGGPEGTVPDDLARGAEETCFHRQGRLRASLSDGRRLKRERGRFVVVKNRYPKNMQLQQREGAGGE